MLFGIFFVIIEAKQLDMKTILRNFFSVLRRFKTASVLNVLGLSIAFVAFMLIMMQVNYDYTFDRSHPNADAIFRVDIVHGSKGSQAIICRPFARAFTGSSPLIEEGCLLSAWTESRFFYIEDGGQRTSYKEDAWNVTPGVLEVFRFDMLEGSERSLDEPNSVVLPESMARKIFGDEIIGFIPDIKFASFRQEVTPMAFYLWGKYQWGQEGNYYDAAYVKFKAGSDLRAGMEHVRESLEKFDSEYPFVVRFYRRGFAAYLRKGIEDRLLDHLVQPCRYLYFDRGRVRPCRVRERVQAERDCRAQGVGIDDGRDLV